MDTALKASAQLREYFVGILADRRREPRDDMVTVLAGADFDGVRMSDEQIYGFMRNLLPARAETTSRSTASLAFGLLTHPAQLAALVADRGLLPQAIEEGIRWETPLLNFMRQTTRDVEFHGVAIPEDSMVSVNLGSANHDEARWDDPERFDIFRERKPHIGFGHGAHVCIVCTSPASRAPCSSTPCSTGCRGSVSTPMPRRRTSPVCTSGPRHTSTWCGIERQGLIPNLAPTSKTSS